MRHIVLILILFFPSILLAERTITGRITDRNDQPISNARVRAFDYDRLSGDDLMGVAFTDANGNYTINYNARKENGGRWDTKYPFLTTWRPNIYIRVSMSVSGRCDSGKWNSTANWERIGESGVRSNHKLRNDLTINLRLANYPSDVSIASFTECINMFCSYNFFFHYKCTGCFDGKKFEWSGWDGLPYSATRCGILENKPNCSQRDLDDISRECNNRVLDAIDASSGARALTNNCKGSECGEVAFKAQDDNNIIVTNNSKEPVELTFKCFPFKNRRKMLIRHQINPQEIITLPAIRFVKVKTKILDSESS